MHYEFGGLIFGGAYTWRGLFSEFYGNHCVCFGYSLELTCFTPFSLFQAYHFFLLAQRQMYEGAIDAAMKTVSN